MPDSGEMQELDEAKGPPLGAVLDFMRLLWAVDHALQSASKRMESTFGMTGPQRLVVRIVGRFPGIAAGRVAEILHVHPSTLTGVLKRLEGRGILQRRPDPRDARRALFMLTAKGRKLDTVRTGTVEQAVRRVLLKEPEKAAAAQEFLASLSHELDAGLR
jgi:MarR family transcriptional regulator, organic hydroperoxide resistance regulator